MASKKVKTPAAAPRRRRTPEEARSEIMAAAERLFAERGPDAVGIQQVAREAGVSHPLIIHYFGSYDALVREVVGARNQRLGAEVLQYVLAEGLPIDADAIINAVLKTLSNPGHARLLAWTALSGEHTGLRQEVARTVAEMIAMRVREKAKAQGVEAPSQAHLTRAFLLATSDVLGFATFRGMLLPVFGLDGDASVDARFRATLRTMVDQYLWHRPAQS